MPGVSEAIAAFLKIVDDSEVMKRIADEYKRRKSEEEKLKAGVDSMKNTPPPKEK